MVGAWLLAGATLRGKRRLYLRRGQCAVLHWVLLPLLWRTPSHAAALPPQLPQVLGSLKCDCREQLHLAMDFIRDNPPGMVIYLQQVCAFLIRGRFAAQLFSARVLPPLAGCRHACPF